MRIGQRHPKTADAFDDDDVGKLERLRMAIDDVADIKPDVFQSRNDMRRGGRLQQIRCAKRRRQQYAGRSVELVRFMPAARSPARAKPRSSAADTSVLPISVSVPVTKSESGVLIPRPR
jgi:hypothetical protein